MNCLFYYSGFLFSLNSKENCGSLLNFISLLVFIANFAPQAVSVLVEGWVGQNLKKLAVITK
jgi:hypothetical protein